MAYIEYRSISDLNSAIINNLSKFPHDVDLIVGIPRSGMLPANLLALYLNKPFTDIDSFIEGKIYSSGERGKLIDRSSKQKVIVVDDSISSGSAIKKAQQKLREIANDYHIIYATIYATSKSIELIDIYCEIIDYTRIFQWNFFHHPTLIPRCCMDIDGVLCQDPPIDDDGDKYLEYITHALPYFIPTAEVNTLVSCRLEKYRPQTEKWLKDHGIKYKHLILLDLPNKEARLKWGKHGEYKGEIYKNSDNLLFVESSLVEAKEICRVSGKQVYCMENFEMIYKNKKVSRLKELAILYYCKYILPIKNKFLLAK